MCDGAETSRAMTRCHDDAMTRSMTRRHVTRCMRTMERRDTRPFDHTINIKSRCTVLSTQYSYDGAMAHATIKQRVQRQPWEIQFWSALTNASILHIAYIHIHGSCIHTGGSHIRIASDEPAALRSVLFVSSPIGLPRRSRVVSVALSFTRLVTRCPPGNNQSATLPRHKFGAAAGLLVCESQFLTKQQAHIPTQQCFIPQQSQQQPQTVSRTQLRRHTAQQSQHGQMTQW